MVKGSDFVENNEKTKILKDLVKFKSVNDHETEVANYLKGLFDKAGIKSWLVALPGTKDRSDLVAEIGSGNPVLAVSGHMDVVDVDRDNWDTDPFELTKNGDKLYGRGATDMKAGLAALVIALLELKESNAHFSGTIRFMATAGEEVGQPGAELLQQKGYLKDVDALLIGEPSGYFRTVFASKGELDLTIDSTGKSAHSSMPYLGNNAVEHLLNVLNDIKAKIKELSDGVSNDVLGKTIFNIDTIHGGNQVNAIPGKAQAQLNLRTIPELENEKILSAFKQVIDNYNSKTNGQVSLSVDMDIIPILGDKDSKLLSLIHQIAKPYVSQLQLSEDDFQQLKHEAEGAGVSDYQKYDLISEGISGGTDASQFLVDQANGFPVVVYGPGNDTPHQDNEYVSEQMFFDFIEIYKKLFVQYGTER